MKKLMIIPIAAAVFFGTVSGEQTATSTVSVVGFKGIGIRTDLARSIELQIESKLPAFCRCTVISQEEIDGSITGLLDGRIAAAGSYAAVNRIVTGTMSRIGPSYNLVLKCIDARSGVLVRSVSREYSGSVEGLFSFAGVVVADLFAEENKPASRIDTLYVAHSALDTGATDKPQGEEVKTAPRVTSDRLNVDKDDGSQWMIEKIGIGALAIFAIMAAIILTDTTR